MGIEVSSSKVVTINDQHQNGVDTSVEGNPTRSRLKGIPLIHVFNRNQKGSRRDDGNPLIHALKGRKGFTIMPFWEQQLMSRAADVLVKAKDDLQGFTYCMPIPSSSPFCSRFARLVSVATGTVILPPSFLRKRQVGELLKEMRTSPPKMRPGLRSPFASQMHAWDQMDPSAAYQAKDVDVGLRQFFNPFTLEGTAPDVQGARVLLVDDLFATGSSVLSVRDIVENRLGATVAGVYFLSGLR